MKIKYTLGQRRMAYILLITLFLQSCSHLSNSLIPIEGQQQEDASQVLVNQDFLQEEDKGCIIVPGGLASTQEDLGEGEEQKSREFQKNEIKTNFYKGYSLEDFNVFPRELLQATLSYLGPKEIGKVSQLNKSFYKLTTGYDQAGLVGVNNQPASDCLKLALNIKFLNFNTEIGRKFTPKSISSLLFFKLLGSVQNLPQAFWPYLKGTSVHTLDLSSNQIGDSGAAELARNLQGTSVHTVYLSSNGIGDSGAAEFAKNLQGTSVHTVDLSTNGIGIGDSGAGEFAKNLQGTSIHTVYLGGNQIGDIGAAEFAKNLQGTRVHRVYLDSNYIHDIGAAEFAKNLQGTSVHTVYLGYNEIGHIGAAEFAKNLQGTRVHTVSLSENQIGDETKELLSRQYPQIKWTF
jgi:hypothetical protein